MRTFLVAAAAALVLAPAAHAAEYVVDPSFGDASGTCDNFGPCALRQALTSAKDNPGPD